MDNQEESVETKFGPLPISWKVLQLGDFLNPEVRARKKPSTEYKSIGIRSHGKGTFPKSSCDPKKIALETLYEVRAGDLVTNITFAWEGAIAIARKEDDFALVSHRFPTYTFRESMVIPDFFQYVIIQRWFVNELGQISPGSAGRNRVLRKTDFLKILVPIPKYEEQKTIARILSTIREAQEKTENVINSLKELKKSLLKHLFTYGAVSLQDSEKIVLRETEIGGIHEEWSTKELQQVGDFQYGYTATANEKEIGPKYVRITDIDLGNNRIKWNHVPYCRIVEKEYEKYQLKEGDILIARIGATTGKTCIVIDPPASVYASYLIRFKPKTVNSLFAYQFTLGSSYWKQISVNREGKLKKGVSSSQLKKFIMPLPSIIEQQKIASVLSSVDSRMEAEEKKRDSIKELFNSMLQYLMTAKLRVNNLEA